MADQPHKSAFAQALEEQFKSRAVIEYDVSGYFGPGVKQIPKIAFRVPTKMEQDRAWSNSFTYVAEMCGANEDAKRDMDMLNDARVAFMTWEYCRDVDDPMYPAFPGPKWMVERLTTDQLGVLLNLCYEVRGKQAPTPINVTAEQLDGLVAAVRGAIDNGQPADVVFAGFPREHLTHILSLACIRLMVHEAAPQEPAQEAAGDACQG